MDVDGNFILEYEGLIRMQVKKVNWISIDDLSINLHANSIHFWPRCPVLI